MSNLSSSPKQSVGKCSVQNIIDDCDLFQDISLQEQELVVGGLSFFDDFDDLDVMFQRTDTSTFGSNDLTGFNGLSSRSRTGYNQTQFTVGFSARRGKDRGGYNGTFGRSGFLNFLFMLARVMFY